MAWDMVKLGDVSKFIRNGASIRQSPDASGLKITRIETISHRVVNLEKCGYANISDDEYLDYRLKKNDILISHINSEIHLGKCAIFLEDRNDIIHGMNLLLLRPNEKIFPIFLFYILSSSEFLKQIVKITKKSVNQASFTVTAFKELQIPLPPLEEQKRIAAILDKAHSIRQKREQNLINADSLIKSIFLDMFGDLVTNPKGWEIFKLSALTTKITDGVHAKPVYVSTGVPFISVINITKGILNFNNCKYVSHEDFVKMTARCKPEQGDILYTKVGATYGIPAYVDTKKDFCLYVSVALIKPIHDKINARFLTFSMKMPYIKRQAQRRIKGIGVPDLHLNQIREFDICVPPRSLQDKFAKISSQIEAQKAKQNQHLHEADQCFKALQQQFFG